MSCFGGSGAIEKNKSESTCDDQYHRDITSAWYLKKIVHPKGDSVLFNYLGAEYSYYSGLTQTFVRTPSDVAGQSCAGSSVKCPDVWDETVCLSKQRTFGVYLSEIVTSQNDKMQLTTIARDDIDNDVLISEINIYMRDNNFVPTRKFTLNYTYSNNNNFTNFYTRPEFLARPFLTSVFEYSGTEENRKYRFHYNDFNALPARLSFAQDHYGYFNGKSNSYLVPKPPSSYAVLYPTNLADRSANPLYAQKGMLTKVEYPTGGYDTLIYEGHTVSESVVTTIPAQLTTATAGLSFKTAKTVVSDTIYSTLTQSATLVTRCRILSPGDYSFGDNYTRIQIYDELGTQVYQRFLDGGQEFIESISLYFEKQYTIRVTTYGASVEGVADLFYQKMGPGQIVEEPVGGVRISKVTTCSSQGGSCQVKRYFYGSLTNLSKSSGLVVNPVSGYFEVAENRIPCNLDVPPGGYEDLSLLPCNNVMGVSSSLQQLYGGGSHIHYRSVVVSEGDNFENGGVQNIFYARENIEGEWIRGQRIRQLPLSNFGWRNGLKLNENYFSKVGNNYVFKKKITNHYTDDDRRDLSLFGYVIRKKFLYNLIVNDTTSPFWPELFSPYDLCKYTIYSKWTYLDTTTTVVYDKDGQNPITTTHISSFDNPVHANPSRLETIMSNGDKQTVFTSYAPDYQAGTLFIDNLMNANMVSLPIEQVKYIDNGMEKKIVSASLTEYQPDGKGLKASEFLLESNASIGSPVFKFSTRQTGVVPPSGSTDSYGADSRYKQRLKYDLYDNLGNVKQLTLKDNISTCYLWGYKQQFVVAEAVGAPIDWIAYAGFEPDAFETWLIPTNARSVNAAITGKQSFDLGMASSTGLLKENLSASVEYIVSYWLMNTNPLNIQGTVGSASKGTTIEGWTYFEHKVTGVTSVRIVGTGLIDELRLYPANAKMTTFTYAPFGGVTSKCDVNNMITYYDYDNFERLKFVKDQNKNILKQMDYKYQSQGQ